MREPIPWPELAREWLSDTHAMLGLLTSLPVGAAGRADARALRALPLAGAACGAAGCVLLIAASAVGLPALVAAVLATAGLVLVGGGLHEDGLADTADGFGGGSDAADKLRIMRDSAIGSYGASALVLSLMARVALAAALAEAAGAAAGGLMLVASGALSRAGIVLVLVILPPARPDGFGHAFARARPTTFVQAAAAGVGIAGLCLVIGLGWAGLLALVLAGALAAASAISLAAIARRQIGGQTGDVCGAAQQAGEIAVLVAFAIVA